MSRYTRLAPTPTVSVTNGGRNREGMDESFLGGNPGLMGGEVRPMISGTTNAHETVGKKIRGERTPTFLCAGVVSRSHLPFPYPLQILSHVHERRGFLLSIRW